MMFSILAVIAGVAAGARAEPGKKTSRKTSRTARPATQPADRDKYPAVRTARQWQADQKRAVAAIGSLTIPVVSLQLCRAKLRLKEYLASIFDVLRSQ
jgi:hypothetical protein